MTEADDVLQLEGAITAELHPGSDVLTFGRGESCDWQIGVGDLGISRLQGGFEYSRGEWWVRNFSTTRPMSIVLDSGLGEAFAVESSRIVDRRTLTVVVTGEVHRHSIFIRRPKGISLLDVPPSDEGDVPTVVALVTTRERWALVALVEGYLLPPPRHDPQPRSYQQVADRLGLPRSTVMKRIENVRKKLYNSGVPGMDGSDARAAIAEHLLASKAVSIDDSLALSQAIVDGEVN